MILLAFLAWLALQAPAADAASSARQDAPPRAIGVGDRVEGILPLRSESGRNVAEAVFELDPGEETTVTLTLESLDFDPLLVVQDPTDGTETRNTNSWRHLNNWVSHKTTPPGKLVVRIGAQDERGGEFVLCAHAGKLARPHGLESLKEAGAYDEAVAERALQRGDEPRASRFLAYASQAALQMGDFVRAKQIAERLIELAEKAKLAEDVVRGKVYLGGAERALGNHERAEKLLLGALGELEPSLGSSASSPDQAQRATLAMLAADDLGEIARAGGSPARAVPFFRKALGFALGTNRPDAESLAHCKLGEVLSRIGNVDEARAEIEKGIGLAEALKRPPALATALSFRARFENAQGFPLEGRSTCEQALELSPFPDVALDLRGTLAEILTNLGRYEEAQAALDTVEAEAANLGVERYAIPIRVKRAWIAYHLWDLPHARALLEEALAMQEASGSLLHRAEILRSLGCVFVDQNKLPDAKKCHADALETCEKTGEREMHVEVLLDRGLLHEKSGELSEAIATYVEAEKLAEAAANPYLLDLARTDRAYALYLRNDHAGARGLAAGVAATRETAGDLRIAAAAYDTLARVGLATGDVQAVEEALCAAERILGLQGVPPSDRFASAGMRSRYADWGAIAQDLVALRLSSRDVSEEQRAALVERGWQEAGHWKGRVLLEDLRRTTSAETAGAPSALAEPALPKRKARTAIVEYVDGLKRLRAYVALAQSIEVVDLGDREPIEKAVLDFVRSIELHRMPPGEFAVAAAALHARLISPLRSRIPVDVDTLLVIPSMAVAALPFEALVDPDSVGAEGPRRFSDLRYLIDKYALVYAPSAPVLAELQRRPARAKSGRCLVLGDPLYQPEGESSRADKVALARPGSIGFDPERLKSTKEEAIEIGRLMLLRDPKATDDQFGQLARAQSARSPALNTSSFDLFLGARAGAELLRGDLTGYQLIHLAAHGHVDPDDPRRSALLLSYEPKTKGLLTLQDVLGLRLEAELTVLSACDTARGPIVRGEGVQSLACAFLQAGSRGVVATLWRVDDLEASQLMKSFYGAYLEEGLHPAAALHRAKLEFLRARDTRGSGPGPSEGGILTPANPYYWASFVYVGAEPP